MFKIILGNQDHTIFQPDEIPAAVDCVDLQIVLKHWPGSLISQEHIVVVVFETEAV